MSKIVKWKVAFYLPVLESLSISEEERHNWQNIGCGHTCIFPLYMVILSLETEAIEQQYNEVK